MVDNLKVKDADAVTQTVRTTEESGVHYPHHIISGNNAEDSGLLRVHESNRMLYPVSEPTLLNIPTYEGSGECVHPSVVFIPNGWNNYKYWMAMTPYPGSDSQLENPSIVVSNDGVNWIEPPGITNPVVESPAGAAYNRDPCLIYAPDESRLYLHWGRSFVSPNGARTYSTDGINWITPHEEYSGTSFGIMRFASDDWRALSNTGYGWLRLDKSINGVDWDIGVQRIVPTNLIGNNWHHSIYHDEAGYHCLSAAYKPGLTTIILNLYYGYSPDGSSFVFDTIPMLNTDTSKWYSRRLYQTCMVPALEEQMYNVYVSGHSTSGGWRIGYFQARLNNPTVGFHSAYKPKPRATEKVIFNGFELRDTDDHDVEVHELNEYHNKALVVTSSLREGGANKNALISVYSDMRTGSDNDILSYGSPGTLDEHTLENSGTASYIITQDHLPALGYLLPYRAGIKVRCIAPAPDAGELTIKLKAWS